jgi:probable addiction module antidote protein
MYFGEDAGNIVVILCGGDKSSQDSDIEMLKPIGRSIRPMGQMRTLDEFTDQYFRDHPEEIDDYLAEIFQEFAEDNDTGALLASLRVIARVQGISDIAEQIGMTRQGVQKALSDEGNPRLGNVTSIMKAMGYCLVPQKLPRSQSV